MENYVSYHGSLSTHCETIRSGKLVIKKFIVAQEAMNDNKSSTVPGSFGYGFYTFIDDKKLSIEFAKKFHKSEDVAALKILSEISENNILDLTVQKDRNLFHEFFHNNNPAVDRLLKNFGKHRDTKLQHVKDGLVIELLLSNLQNKKRLRIDAVVGESYTPTRDGIYSYIPNGKELCIRNKSVITSIEAC